MPQFLGSVCREAQVVGLVFGQADVPKPTLCAQVPFATPFVAAAQLMHPELVPAAESAQAVAQQTLSTQNPVAHWPPAVQAVPVACVCTHLPFAPQKKPAAHPVLTPLQLVAHAVAEAQANPLQD